MGGPAVNSAGVSGGAGRANAGGFPLSPSVVDTSGAASLPQVYNGHILNPSVAPTMMADRPSGSASPSQSLQSRMDADLAQFNSMRGTPEFAFLQNQWAQRQLAQQGMGLQQQQLLGMAGPNGQWIPGSIANNATHAQADMTRAINQPRAEDVAADQGAEAQLQSLMNTRFPRDEMAAMRYMQQNGQRLSRRMMGALGMPMQNQAPNQTQNPSQNPNQGVTPDQQLINRAANQASAYIPIINGSRAPYGNANGVDYRPQYHDSITSFLSAIPDDVLQRNWATIRDRLNSSEFGGQPVMNEWMSRNVYTNPLNGNVISTTPLGQQHGQQIQRFMRMAGMNMGSPDYGALGYFPSVYAVNKIRDYLR